jgi:phosphoenolpyruvate---glycerone phosphotransferase subunit DhaL
VVTGADVVAFLERVRVRTEAAQEELDRLDAVAGDGDHGVTMVLGWRAAASAVAASEATTPGAVLRCAAAAFADVGGSAGPLWGTALIRAGRALGDETSVDVAALARAAEAAVRGMCERGRCEIGDCTVVDAMAPAATALAAAAASGASPDEAVAEAAEAAAEGAARTREIVPRHGRTALAPGRAAGHEDAGARAAAVFWAAGCARREFAGEFSPPDS